ncbi:MAG: LVIVD repeat-containing protein [Candidatus Hodarchaeota archaeon]
MNFKQNFCILFILIILTTQIQSVLAEDLQCTVQLEEKGTISSGSVIFDLYVANNLLYFLDKGGFNIYNVTDISQISFVGEYSSPYAHDLHIDTQENLAYILDPKDGLMVLDIQDPQNPLELSKYIEVSGTNFFINDDLLFLGDEENGLKILDTSNSSKLTLVASWSDLENNSVGGIFVYNPYAFLGLRSPNIDGPPTPLELQVLNIGDLEDISEVCEVFNSSDDYAGGSPSYLNEELLIISDYSKGVKFIDFSDPSNPTLINTYNDGGEANDLKAVNDYLFVVDGLDGLEILDISDLNNIKEIGSISLSYYMARIDIVTSTNLLYLGGVCSGIKIIEYSINKDVNKASASGFLIGFLIPIVIVVYRNKIKKE